jgi:hypothetical protein
MFWKFDDEEGQVVPRKEALPVKKNPQNPDEEFPDSDETGAEDRFVKRIAAFKEEEKPVYKHHVWWLIHNCVAHPLIGVLPCKKTFDFHDWTSKKINGQ